MGSTFLILLFCDALPATVGPPRPRPAFFPSTLELPTISRLFYREGTNYSLKALGQLSLHMGEKFDFEPHKNLH